MKRVEWPLEIQVPRATVSQNELRRKYRHKHAYKALRELWELEIASACQPRTWLLEIRSCVMAQPKMRLEIICRRKRLLDYPNLIGGLKPVIDAVKKVGLILDDSPRYMELQVSQEKSQRGRAVTIFRLEPVQ